MDRIKGGYYIKARCISESDIAHAAPCVREIWDYLLRECNHQPIKGIDRGQTVRRMKDISEALHWYVGYRKETYNEDQCERAMKWLKNAGMITATKTVRGMVITICNYAYYSDPKNYERGDEDGNENPTSAGRPRQGCGTINNKGKKDNKGTRKKKENPPGDAAAVPEGSLFGKFLLEYNDFLLREAGTPEQFSVAGRAGLVKIIAYLKAAVKMKNDREQLVQSEEEIESRILEGWKLLLSKYEFWEDFHKKQLKLEQIHSNLINIIKHVKTLEDAPAKRAIGKTGGIANDKVGEFLNMEINIG